MAERTIEQHPRRQPRRARRADHAHLPRPQDPLDRGLLHARPPGAPRLDGGRRRAHRRGPARRVLPEHGPHHRRGAAQQGGRRPRRLGLPRRERRVRPPRHRRRPDLDRPAPRRDRAPRRQDRGQADRPRGEGPGDPGHRPRHRGRAGAPLDARGERRLPGHAQGGRRRRRARHGQGRARRAPAHGDRPGALGGEEVLRQRDRAGREVRRARPAHRGPDHRRPARQRRAPLRARVHDPAAPPEDRRGGALPDARHARCARRSAPPRCA